MPSASAAPSVSTSPIDPFSDPPVTGRPNRTKTVRGVVSDGVEPGCLLLDTGTQTLQLLGVRPAQAPPGDRVVVTGTLRPDLATTCQQGTAFQVTAIRADGN